MKKLIFLFTIAVVLFSTINVNAQIARKLDYKAVAEIKKSPTYFILYEGAEEFNEKVKESFEKHWTFNEMKFEYYKNIDKLKKKKDITVLGIGFSTITIGSVSGSEAASINNTNRSTGNPTRVGPRGGTSAETGGIIISRSIKKRFLNTPKYWLGGISINFNQDQDQLYLLPLYIKVLNNIFITIEENKTSKFTYKKSAKIYGSKKGNLKDRTLYILEKDIPAHKKGEDFTKIDNIKKYYKGGVKIVTEEELKKAVEEEDDKIVYLHFYRELHVQYYTAISCNTGEVYSLSLKKANKKSFKKLLEELNN